MCKASFTNNSCPLPWSRRTLRSMLTKVKDTLPPGKQSNVVYRIPCSCGQVYIGETKRRLETRLKEHRDACERGMTEKSAVVEHAWEHHHPIHWEETTVLDHGRGQELLVKEALHIQMTPVEERFNRDGGLEVPGCWTAVMKRQGGRRNPHLPLTSNDVILGSANSNAVSHFFHFRPDDDWSIQSKRRQSYFPNSSW